MQQLELCLVVQEVLVSRWKDKMSQSKRREHINTLEERKYQVSEAVEFFQSSPKLKFNESIDVAINLGIDTSKSDQNMRGATILPAGSGKPCKVAVFVEGDQAKEAEEAGADAVGMEDLAEEFKKGEIDYDVVIATPDTMKIVSPLGKVLGPKGIMPNPKTGTVTMDIGKAITDIKGGKIDFKVDKTGIIHASVGKVSFTADKIKDNANELINTIVKLKPSSLKGTYVKSISISSTMSPGIAIETKVE